VLIASEKSGLMWHQFGESKRQNKDLRISEEFEGRTIFSLIEFLSLSIYYLNISTILFLSLLFPLSLPEMHWAKKNIYL
jgi:hypothetical protein